MGVIEPALVPFLPSEEWIDAFKTQCTDAMRMGLRTYARRRARGVGRAGAYTDDAYADDLVANALADTLFGVVAWEPSAKTPYQHAEDTIRIEHGMRAVVRREHELDAVGVAVIVAKPNAANDSGTVATRSVAAATAVAALHVGTVIAISRRAFPELTYTVEDVVAEGDRVAMRWHWTGTYEGSFRGIAPSARSPTRASRSSSCAMAESSPPRSRRIDSASCRRSEWCPGPRSCSRRGSIASDGSRRCRAEVDRGPRQG